MKSTGVRVCKFASPPLKTEPSPTLKPYNSGFGHPQMSPRAPQPIKASKVTVPPLPVQESLVLQPQVQQQAVKRMSTKVPSHIEGSLKCLTRQLSQTQSKPSFSNYQGHTMFAKYSSKEASSISSTTSKFLARHLTTGENLMDHLNTSGAISADDNHLLTQPCYGTDLGSPIGPPAPAFMSKIGSVKVSKFKPQTHDHLYEKNFGASPKAGGLGLLETLSNGKWAKLSSYKQSRVESSQARSKLSHVASARSQNEFAARQLEYQRRAEERRDQAQKKKKAEEEKQLKKLTFMPSTNSNKAYSNSSGSKKQIKIKNFLKNQEKQMFDQRIRQEERKQKAAKEEKQAMKQFKIEKTSQTNKILKQMKDRKSRSNSASVQRTQHKRSQSNNSQISRQRSQERGESLQQADGVSSLARVQTEPTVEISRKSPNKKAALKLNMSKVKSPQAKQLFKEVKSTKSQKVMTTASRRESNVGSEKFLPAFEINVSDLDAKIDFNAIKKGIASRFKALRGQKPPALMKKCEVSKKRNEALVMRNFLKEFHETMLETVGTSNIRHMVYPEDSVNNSDYALQDVEIEVDLLEVLQRMSFLTLHSADIETQENCITLSGQEQKGTFQNNLLTLLCAVQSINIRDHHPLFKEFQPLTKNRMQALLKAANPNQNYISRDISRDNLSLNTSRISQRSRGTQARVDATALTLVDALQSLLVEHDDPFSLNSGQIVKLHQTFMNFYLNRRDNLSARRQEALKEAEDSKYSYKPNVKMSQLLVPSSSSRRSPVNQPQSYFFKMEKDKFERNAKIESIKAAQERSELEECTFRPQVNPLSTKIAYQQLNEIHLRDKAFGKQFLSESNDKLSPNALTDKNIVNKFFDNFNFIIEILSEQDPFCHYNQSFPHSLDFILHDQKSAQYSEPRGR